ncbi:MAG: SulP family inorganic anion transporter [Ignavibacteria bacterium]|nr:SulP family inorganic anion transporter [Ignavibacteria bacterium]
MLIINSRLISPGAVLITLVCMAIMLLWEHPRVKAMRWSTVVSGTLIAVVVGTLINSLLAVTMPQYALIGHDHLVTLPSIDFSKGVAEIFVTPNFSSIARIDVWVVALTIAVIASIESILCLEAVDKMDPERRISDSGRELFAQGIGNTLSGLIGGLPVTSVIVRSSANVYAGGRTRTSSFIHGITLLFAVLILPSVLNQIPLACLAAVLLMIGYKLSSIKIIRATWHEGYSQFIPFIVTLVVIVAKDILMGVGVGLVVSTFFVMRSYHRKSITCVHDGPNYLIRFNKDITFVHKSLLKETLRNIPDNTSLTIDGVHANYIDHDIHEMMTNFLEGCPTRNISVRTIGVYN